MARLTNEDRELILADFHTGQFSIRELAIKHTIGKTTIANICKGIEPKNKIIVDTLVAVHTELSEQSGQEVDSVQKIVDKKTEHLKLINDNATKLANKLSIMADQIDTPTDLKTLTEANDKLAITLKVAERHASKIDVTQQQMQSNNTAPIIEVVEDKQTANG